MRIISAEDVDTLFSYPALIDVLRDGFRSDVIAPLRHHHAVNRGNKAEAFMLLMPAWHDLSSSDNGYMGVKLVNVFPDNGDIGEPGVYASYVLMAGRTGKPLAMIDGGKLTTWRTAAASALGSDYLARKDASKMVMVGSGAMAPYLIKAHSSVRPIGDVTIWNRNLDKAVALAKSLDGDLPLAFSVTDNLENAVRDADLISCATFSDKPLVHGEWLKAGAHLDLVGAFRPDLRESDDEAVRRADVFVDTRSGALAEGGDVIQPIRDGVISEADVLADLFDLTRGAHPGRTSDNAITLFKSTGASLEDLVAATHLFECIKEPE